MEIYGKFADKGVDANNETFDNLSFFFSDSATGISESKKVPLKIEDNIVGECRVGIDGTVVGTIDKQLLRENHKNIIDGIFGGGMRGFSVGHSKNGYNDEVLFD